MRLPSTVPLEVRFTFLPLAGGDPVGATIGGVGHGRAVREVDVTGCADGCRLAGLSTSLEREDQLRLTIHGVRQLDPPGDVVPAAELGRPARWRPADNVRISAAGGALSIAGARSPFDQRDFRVAAIDGTLPVPVAATGELPPNRRLSSLDGGVVAGEIVASPTALPRLGSDGALVDLENLERTSLLPPRRGPAEVWLGPAAPADAPERLRRAGLAVSATTGIEASQRALARQGPALALHFHVAAAALGILLGLGGLGLVATVDRRRQADDLRALRRQGLPRRHVRRAALWGYLATVLAAAVAGLVAAGAAWVAAGDRVPIFIDGDVVRPPRWPEPEAVLTPWVLAAAGLVVASVVIGWALRRAVARGPRSATMGNGRG
jgi:hypothetical protein